MATKTPEQKVADEAAKKTKLLAELAALGITSTGGTETIAPLTGTEDVKALTALVKKAKDETGAGKAPAGGSTPSSVTAIEVKHLDHKGEVATRVFSKEVHGPDFAKLADQFKTTNAAKIVPDDTPTA